MEQAINTFTGGLSIDTHPMVLNNETLTDALNATIVTMNGNEVILQNDMGNRRVDHAYLPPGYEPVGIKEYGGIIYVASHNPITGKSLIGSFPSPQRRFGTRDVKDGELNVCSAFRKKLSTIGEVTLDCLDNESVLIPLSRMNKGPLNESRTKELEYVLHAGDKFIIWSEDIWGNDLLGKNNITNFNNVNGTKLISPKNKLFTLAIGVMNSLNEFVDITSSLVRWNGTNSISKDPDKSDKYYFNEGYFIASGESSNFKDAIETAQDLNYIQNRNASDLLTTDANTYAYKLVGPLYLKATINHVLNFNYSLEGYFSNEKLYLWVFSTITYNCPDGITGSGSDEEYANLGESLSWSGSSSSTAVGTDPGTIIGPNPGIGIETGIGTGIGTGTGILTGLPMLSPSISMNPNTINSSSTSPWYDLYIEGLKLTSLAFNQSKTSYNKETNLYTAENRRCYIIKGNITKSSILDYTIAVRTNSIVDGCIPTYIEGLSSSGKIDISKLGTGEIELQGWRFYNYPETKQTILTYELGAYPKYGKKFNGLKFEVLEVRETNARTISGKQTTNINNNSYKLDLPANNGKTTIILNWDSFNLDFRKLYKVEIKSLGETQNSEIGNLSIQESNVNNISINSSTLTQSIQYPEIKENLSLTRWILTTELMNVAYNRSSDYFILDYGYPHSELEKSILDDLLTVKIKNNFSYADNSELSEQKRTYVEVNGVLKKSSELGHLYKYDYYWIKPKIENVYYTANVHDIRWEHTLDLDVQLASRATVNLIELYPDYVKEDLLYSYKKYSIINDTNGNPTYNSEQEVEIIKKGEIELNPEDFVELKNIAILGTNLTGQILLYDWFKCTLILNNTRPVLYPMDRVSKHLLELVSSTKNFGGVGLDFDNKDGSLTKHFLYFYPPIEISKGRPTPIRCIDDYDYAENVHADRLNGEGVVSNKMVFNKDQYGDSIMAELNKFPANLMLVFAFSCNGILSTADWEYTLGNSYKKLHISNPGEPSGYYPSVAWYGTQMFTNTVEYITNNFLNQVDDEGHSLSRDNWKYMPNWPLGKYCARVWWRGVNGRWSLIEDVFNAGRVEFDEGVIDNIDIKNYLNGVVYYKYNGESIDNIQSGLSVHEGLWKYSNKKYYNNGVTGESPWNPSSGNTFNQEYGKLSLAEKLACLIYDKVLNKKDFLYCYTNELGEDDNKIYIPNRALCAYNNYFTSNIIVPIKFEYKLLNLLTTITNYSININNHLSSSNYNNIKILFKLNLSNTSNSDGNYFIDIFNYIRTLESNKNFEKYTTLYTGSGALSNIFIETGDIVNSYGEYFKPQLIYPIKFNGIYTEGTITFIDKFDTTFVTDINNPFLSILVSKDGKSKKLHNNRNILLYARNNPGNPYYLYDVMGIIPNVNLLRFPLVGYDHESLDGEILPSEETNDVEKKGLTAMSYAGFNIAKYDK